MIKVLIFTDWNVENIMQEKYSGKDCIVFEIPKGFSWSKYWVDKKTGLLLKAEDKTSVEENEYKLNIAIDEDIKYPG